MSGCITTDSGRPYSEVVVGADEKKEYFINNSENDKVMQEKNNRTEWLHLRLKSEEYKKIHDHFSKTTSRKFSDYARKNLLAKPLVTTYLNQSLDDFMAEMIVLRKEQEKKT